MKYSPSLARLIDALRILPGVGPKSAQRMAFYLLERNRDGARALAGSLVEAADEVVQARGYSMRDSLGTLAAGGTLGILIPPSVNMIVYGSLTNNSIGKLFIAGIIPACCSPRRSCSSSTCAP